MLVQFETSLLFWVLQLYTFFHEKHESKHNFCARHRRTLCIFVVWSFSTTSWVTFRPLFQSIFIHYDQYHLWEQEDTPIRSNALWVWLCLVRYVYFINNFNWNYASSSSLLSSSSSSRHHDNQRWFSKRTETLLDNGACMRSTNTQIWSTKKRIQTIPSALPSSADVPALLLTQPIVRIRM